MGNKVDFLILGGGLSGLLLAQELEKRQKSFLIIEKNKRLGGRMGSERINGFTLDLGFQVSLSSYDWIQTWGDTINIGWHEFDSGAYIHTTNALYPIFNPIWHLRSCLLNLDKAPQKMDLIKTLLPILWIAPESVAQLSSLELLKKLTIPTQWIDSFFKPFFGGVLLDRDLQTSASLFVYLFKKFVTGRALYPYGGFQNLINKMASQISRHHILLDQQVTQINPEFVLTQQQQRYDFTTLIQTYPDEMSQVSYQMTHNLWYAAPKKASHRPQSLLHLNGQSQEPIAHACILSDIAPELAPIGYHLISATVTSPSHNFNYQEANIRQTLIKWFTPLGIEQLELLKIQIIPKALPSFQDLKVFNPTRYIKKSNHHFLIGDHWSIPSQDGVGQAVKAFIKNEIDQI